MSSHYYYITIFRYCQVPHTLGRLDRVAIVWYNVIKEAEMNDKIKEIQRLQAILHKRFMDNSVKDIDERGLYQQSKENITKEMLEEPSKYSCPLEGEVIADYDNELNKNINAFSRACAKAAVATIDQLIIKRLKELDEERSKK